MTSRNLPEQLVGVTKAQRACTTEASLILLERTQIAVVQQEPKDKAACPSCKNEKDKTIVFLV